MKNLPSLLQVRTDCYQISNNDDTTPPVDVDRAEAKLNTVIPLLSTSLVPWLRSTPQAIDLPTGIGNDTHPK